MMTFYVFSPASYHTGGPEALHQLGDALIGNGAHAEMAYFNQKPGVDPKCPEYQVYNTITAATVTDGPETVVIVPEIAASLFSHFPRSRHCVWWLSVDNYFPYANGPNRVDFTDQRIVHICQSAYAEQFVRFQGATTVLRVSDYLHERLIRRDAELQRRDIVLYNPAKGMEFTAKLIASHPEIAFVPLAQLKRAGLRALLECAKVYIDFGHHPGKDRMPREAAALGCCVITSTLGSAGVHEDVPIHARYKFDLAEEAVAPIGHLIADVFANFGDHIGGFAGYRADIADQERVFRNEAGAFALSMATLAGRTTFGDGPALTTAAAG